MDDFSKQQALAKVCLINKSFCFLSFQYLLIIQADAIDRKIGYPDTIFNDTYMDNLYKDVKIPYNKEYMIINLKISF